MTDAELMALYDISREPQPVRVQASDYAYNGWLMSVFHKRRGATRCVVEDANKRLFIHNAGQISKRAP